MKYFLGAMLLMLSGCTTISTQFKEEEPIPHGVLYDFGAGKKAWPDDVFVRGITNQQGEKNQ